MAGRVDVVKAYKKLPYEAQQQIDNILDDDGLKLRDVKIDYLVEDVKWTVERMGFDMADHWEHEEEYKFALDVKKQCLKWLKYYSKYVK